MSNTAGTLVSAIFESAGYLYQSAILDKLADPLSNSIGALVYLIGLGIVIVQFTVLKQSKGAAWILIGPALFISIISSRTDLEEAKWKFGSSERQQAKVGEGVRLLTDGQNPGQGPATVFGRYVRMVGAVVEEVVKTINGTQLKNDQWFLFKGEVFGQLGVRRIENTGLKMLIHHGLLGQCHKAMDAARTVVDPLRRTRPGQSGGVQDSSSRLFAEDLAKAQVEFEKAMNAQVTIYKAGPIKDYLKSLEGGAQDGGATGADGSAGTEDSPVSYSCQQIWLYILQGIQKEAEIVEEQINREARKRELDPAVVKNLISLASAKEGDQLKSVGAAGAVDINKIIAGYLLRNDMRERDMGSMIASFIGRNDLRKLETRMMGGESAETEYARIGLEEWSEKERLIQTALTLPYYQGIALYFLGVFFPFFALLLLIPGKWQGFILWFLLWLWIKSWDIGFAVVMKLDTLFWGIFVTRKAEIAKEFGDDQVLDLEGLYAIAALDRLDPSFQMGTYYSMIGLCLAAVPVVSAQLILGSTTSGAGIISAGVNKYSEFFSESAKSMAAQSVAYRTKSEAESLKEQRGLFSMAEGLSNYVSENGGARNFEGVAPGSPLGVAEGRMFPSAVGQAYRLSNITEGITRLPRTGLPGTKGAEQLNTAVALQEQAAKAAGQNAPFSFFDARTAGLIQRAASIVTAGERNIGKTLGKTEVEVINAAFANQEATEAWKASEEGRAYELHKQLALYGGIPVPWSSMSGSEGALEDYKRTLAEFAQRMDLLKATINLGSDYVGQTIGAGADAGNSYNPDWTYFGKAGADAKSKLFGYTLPLVAGVAGTAISLNPEGYSILGSMIDPDNTYGWSDEERKRRIDDYIEELPPEVRLNLFGDPDERENFSTNPISDFSRGRQFRNMGQ